MGGGVAAHLVERPGELRPLESIARDAVALEVDQVTVTAIEVGAEGP
jgi:hypothetical protein